MHPAYLFDGTNLMPASRFHFHKHHARFTDAGSGRNISSDLPMRERRSI
jgi:hypothetical protein